MSFKLTGAKEIQRALFDLSTKEALKVGRAALRKAARAILLDARARVPVKEGRLKKALALEVDRGRVRTWLFANVKVKRVKSYRPSKSAGAKLSYQVGSTPEVYGAFVEFGTRKMAPRPFMRPAWDSQGGETALVRIGRDLGAGIEAAAGKRV